MGRFKGGAGSIHHLQAVFNNLYLKLKVILWLERLNNELISPGQINVPACCDEGVNLAETSQYQETFLNFFYKNSTGTLGYNLRVFEC